MFVVVVVVVTERVQKQPLLMRLMPRFCAPLVSVTVVIWWLNQVHGHDGYYTDRNFYKWLRTSYFFFFFWCIFLDPCISCIDGRPLRPASRVEFLLHVELISCCSNLPPTTLRSAYCTTAPSQTANLSTALGDVGTAAHLESHFYLFFSFS